MLTAAFGLAAAYFAMESMQKDAEHKNTSSDPAIHPFGNVPPPSQRHNRYLRFRLPPAEFAEAPQRPVEQRGLFHQPSYRGLHSTDIRRGIESSELPLQGYNATDVNVHWKWARTVPHFDEGDVVVLRPIREDLVLPEYDEVLGKHFVPPPKEPRFNPSTGMKIQ